MHTVGFSMISMRRTDPLARVSSARISSTRVAQVGADPGRVDLHMHTDRSDGRYPPEEVLARAVARRLDVIAVTDHDLPNVIAAGTHAVAGRTIRVIAAVELSGNHAGREFHLLV